MGTDGKYIRKLSADSAVIAGIFTVIVSILLLVNYLQVRTHEPLESKVLESFLERINNSPDNEELRIELRNYDLLARKAFFTGQRQVKTGGYLLLFGSVILILSLRIYYSYSREVELPDEMVKDNLSERMLSQRWVVVTGGSLIVLALIAGYATRSHFRIYAGSPQTSTTLQPDRMIEQIVVSARTDPMQQTSDAEVALSDKEPAAVAGIPQSETPADIREAAPAYPDAAEIRKHHSAFRGPWGNGISYHGNIPVDWDGSTGKNLKWKVRVPKQGNNSPVIWGNLLFLAGADATSRVVYCYDSNTGKPVWQKEVSNIPGSPAVPPKTTDDTGLSAPSLTTDGQRVYAIFGTGDVVAFDTQGNQLWGRNLGVPDNHYGHSSSLISWKDKLLVQFDSNKGGRVLALNVHTGEIVWDKRRNAKISWASPILAEINSKYQMVVSADPTVSGYDIENGNELWSVKCMSGEVGPSPAYGGGLIYAANEYARLAAINPLTGTVVWETNEYLPEVSSPVVGNGLLFVATTYGVFACYDATNGKKQWEKEFSKGFYSSPVIADNKVYALDMGGIAHIFEVSGTPKLLAEPALVENVVTTPAFANGRIYIRGEEHLYCIGK